MSFLFVTLALALGVALVTGGRLRNIAATELRYPGILAAAAGIQLGLEILHPTRGTAGHLASALLVVSYVFLLLFCAVLVGTGILRTHSTAATASTAPPQ